MRAPAWIVVALGLTAGCAAVIPHATLAHAQRSGVALETLEQGRGLFVVHCGNCHYAPDPGTRDSASWAKLFPEMLEDSHLTPEDAAQVLAFLKALASDSTVGIPAQHADRTIEPSPTVATP